MPAPLHPTLGASGWGPCCESPPQSASFLPLFQMLPIIGKGLALAKLGGKTLSQVRHKAVNQIFFPPSSSSFQPDVLQKKKKISPSWPRLLKSWNTSGGRQVGEAANQLPCVFFPQPCFVIFCKEFGEEGGEIKFWIKVFWMMQGGGCVIWKKEKAG